MIKRTTLKGIAQTTSLPENTSVRATRLTTYFWLLIVIWTIIIICLLALDFLQTGWVQREMAKTEARANFNKDQAFRFWSSKHGGVYVPINSRTPQNPFLSHVPERDITTESGKALTLMNPAYMLRQMLEEYENLFGVHGHITSLKHYRPETAPDEWERTALLAFERGDKEVLEFTEIEGTPYLRLMRPMIAKKSCLKCHVNQGYKVGDVRGGVSVSVPMSLYVASQRKVFTTHVFGFGLVWLLGIAGIGMATRGLRNRNRARDKAEAALQKAHEKLEVRVEERTVELNKEIEERKQAEEALLNQTYFLQKAQEIGQIGTWELDIKKNELLWTDENYKIFGLPIGTKLTYEIFLNCVHPDDREYVDKEWKAAFDKKPYDIEHRLLVDGDVKWVREKAELQFNEKDECVSGTGFSQDITDAKKTAEALRESEERYRTVADFAYDWEDWIAPDGRYLYVSPSCERITGYGSDEFINDPGLFEKIIRPDDYSKVVDHFRGEEGLEKLPSVDFRIITRSGEERWINHVCQPVHSTDGQYLGRRGSNRDISKQKLMQEELLKTKKLESLGVLAGGIAHDFNNLMSAVVGYISLARMEMKPGSKGFKNLIEAEKASIQTKGLTARLITFSKGGGPIKETVSIGDLVKGSVDSSLKGSDLDARFSIPDDISPVEIDEEQMKQAVHNIIANAQEAMAEQGMINVSCENIDIGVQDTLTLKDGKYVKISIEDQGPGIPEEDLIKIFDPYFSTKEMGTQKGMGLGLSASDSIVKQHDGIITVESELGTGTTFSIYLPACVKEIVEAALVKKPVPEISVTQGGKILVMDDEEVIRDVCNALLTHLGYEAEVAVEGVEAIEMYRKAMESEKPFDMVILDLTNKVGMGGAETMAKLLEIDPAVKAIVATGYSNDPIISNFREHGFRSPLPKPFTLDQLKTALQDAFAGE